MLHCVVIGGGPTGVEFSGELSDFIMRDVRERYTHVKDYIQVTLIEVLICNFFPCLFINCVEMKYDYLLILISSLNRQMRFCHPLMSVYVSMQQNT